MRKQASITLLILMLLACLYGCDGDGLLDDCYGRGEMPSPPLGEPDNMEQYQESPEGYWGISYYYWCFQGEYFIRISYCSKDDCSQWELLEEVKGDCL